MFQFPGLASCSAGCRSRLRRVAPFGHPRVERVFAPHRGFSQLVTSFFASESLGILHVPFSPFLVLLESRLLFHVCLKVAFASALRRFRRSTYSGCLTMLLQFFYCFCIFGGELVFF